MAISIISNPTAIAAQSSVNNANNSLSKTLKSLSTGLRINSAADDASGLAVSEKLRAQISGLNKAAANAQDAISMLQTAESAMGSITSMVQRIRELAIQSGDPAYTSNDRAMLQLEVDQLKEEIDRVSSSSEFNTKKLLNGDAAATWSTSNKYIGAIVKGAASEGDYKISYLLDPGKNSVYKTNIMRLGDGSGGGESEISYSLKDNGIGLTKIDNAYGINSEKNVSIAVGRTTSNATVQTGQQCNSQGNYYYLKHRNNGNYVLNNEPILMRGFFVGDKDNLQHLYIQRNSSSKSFTANGKTYTGTAAQTVEVNGVALTITYDGAKTFTFAPNEKLYSSFSASTTTFADDDLVEVVAAEDVLSYTGNNGNVRILTGTNNRYQRGSYYLELEVLEDFYKDGINPNDFKIRVRTKDVLTGELSDWEDVNISRAGYVKGEYSLFGDGCPLFNNSTSLNANNLKKGDKLLAALSKGPVYTAGEVASDIANGITAYGTIRFGEKGPIAVIKDLTNTDNAGTYTIYTAQMDKTGEVSYGQMDLTFGSRASTGSATLDILGAGDVAAKDTKLSQIAGFTNADGRMVLDNTQEISIYGGNGNVAKVLLEGSDTIADLENKLKLALIEQLDMGADKDDADALTVNNNLVKYVDEEGTGDRSVAGTFVIQGAALGTDSNLTFVGDESVLNALGINQIQKATDSALTISVEDMNRKNIVGEDTVTDGRLRNVIKGVDVYVKPSTAANISFDTDKNKMVFTPKKEAQTGYLHIKNNATKAAIGANEGQTLDISIGRVDTKSMNINNINVATFDDAQKAITKLDLVLEDISKKRATAGGQISRLEYTINNLNTARENMVAAESRIRDLDIAVASTNLASQTILMQSATAMLAQANKIPNYAIALLS